MNITKIFSFGAFNKVFGWVIMYRRKLLDDITYLALISDTMAPFYQHELFLILAWLSNHMSSKMCHEIIHTFPKFNSCT